MAICTHDRRLWIWIYPWISMDIHGKSVDMDMDGKFHIHGKPAIFGHFVAVHSWSVHCSQRSHKSIKPLIADVQGLSKSSMLIRLKSSSLMLVVIGSVPMVICNRFHERLANNGKITTFTGVPLFDALMCRFPWTWKIETWTVESYVQCWKSHTQLLHVCLNWSRRNSLLKSVSQPEITKKSINPLFWRLRSSKVIEFGGNREPVYDFLLVINSNIGLM